MAVSTEIRRKLCLTRDAPCSLRLRARRCSPGSRSSTRILPADSLVNWAERACCARPVIGWAGMGMSRIVRLTAGIEAELACRTADEALHAANAAYARAVLARSGCIKADPTIRRRSREDGRAPIGLPYPPGPWRPQSVSDTRQDQLTPARRAGIPPSSPDPSGFTAPAPDWGRTQVTARRPVTRW